MFCVRPTLEDVFNTRPKNLDDPAIRFLAEENVAPPTILIRHCNPCITSVDIYSAFRDPRFPQRMKTWVIPGLPKILDYDLYTAMTSLYVWAMRICENIKEPSNTPFYGQDTVVYFHKWKRDALFDGVLPLVAGYNPCIHIPEPPEKVAKNVA